MKTPPHDTSNALAQRLNAHARVCEVVASQALSSCLHEVVLRGDAQTLAGVPGNDVMIRLANDAGAFTRRRYSVRSVEPDQDQFSLWISTIHDGVGSRWAQGARAGDEVDVVGPRGKIPLDPDADWHLFMGDVTGYSAFYRLAQSITPPGRATFIVEIDHDDDAISAPFDEAIAVNGIFVHRYEKEPNDPGVLLSGLSAFALPPGLGHAYLFGEFSVTKVLRDALMDRGMSDEQISRKAYWRIGRQNADNGEPEKDES
jgi:NADPH-dependent ferric siderophore reductase